jgi:hypothetical protein
MNHHRNIEPLSPSVLSGLRVRLRLRRALIAMLLAFPVLSVIAIVAPAWHPVPFVLSLSAIVSALGFAIYLAFGSCPQCGKWFSPWRIYNFFMFPWPTCFASECESCGISLRRAS